MHPTDRKTSQKTLFHDGPLLCFYFSSSSTSSWCRCTCGLPSWAAAPSSGPPSCASLGRTAMARPVWLSRSSWTHVKLWRRCVRPGWPGRSKRPNGKTKARRKEWKRMPLQSFRLLSRGGKTESSLPPLKPARWELRSEWKQNHWILSLSVTRFDWCGFWRRVFKLRALIGRQESVKEVYESSVFYWFFLWRWTFLGFMKIWCCLRTNLKALTATGESSKATH